MILALVSSSFFFFFWARQIYRKCIFKTTTSNTFLILVLISEAYSTLDQRERRHTLDDTTDTLPVRSCTSSWIALLTTLTPNLLHSQWIFPDFNLFRWQHLKPHIYWQIYFPTLTHFSLSFSGCLSARGVWVQKGLPASVGLLRWLALPTPIFPPTACYSMVCPTDLSSCMDSELCSFCLLLLKRCSVKPGWGFTALILWHLDVMCTCWYSMLQGAPCVLLGHAVCQCRDEPAVDNKDFKPSE